MAPVAALASTPVHEHRQSLDALDAIEPESPAEHAYLQEQRDLLLRQISEAQQPQLSRSLNVTLVAPDLAAAHLPLGRPTQQQTGRQVGDVGGDVDGDLGTGICVPGDPLPTDSIKVVRMKHLENHSPSPALLRIVLFHPREELTFIPPPPPPPSSILPPQGMRCAVKFDLTGGAGGAHAYYVGTIGPRKPKTPPSYSRVGFAVDNGRRTAYYPIDNDLLLSVASQEL